MIVTGKMSIRLAAGLVAAATIGFMLAATPAHAWGIEECKNGFCWQSEANSSLHQMSLRITKWPRSSFRQIRITSEGNTRQVKGEYATWPWHGSNSYVGIQSCRKRFLKSSDCSPWT